MSFRSVKPTQPELARLRTRSRFLRKGQALLEIKRQQLQELLKKATTEFFNARKVLVIEITQDFQNLRRCYEIMGKDKVSIISRLAKINFTSSVDIRFLNKLGIDVPEIKLNISQKTLPNYSFSDTPLHLDILINHLKITLQRIIKLAELDSVLSLYAQNYQKIQRRINALEDLILPRLNSQIKMIEEIMEDIDQEEFVQIKKIKEFLELIAEKGE